MNLGIRVGHIEVTQGIQTFDNSMPLVSGKPTVVRVFPKTSRRGIDVPGVNATLHAYRGGEYLSSILSENGPITVGDRRYRGDVDSALDFLLEPDWLVGDIEIQVKIMLSDGVELDENNDLSARKQISFHPRQGLSIRYVKVQFQGRSPGPRVTTQQAANFLRAVYPCDPETITYEPWHESEFKFDETDQDGNLDGAKLILELNRMYYSDPSADRLYGWTPSDSFPHHGLADPLFHGDGAGRVAFGNDTGVADDPMTWRWRRTFAHEIGHNTNEIGLTHPPRNPFSPRFQPPQLRDSEFGYDVQQIDPFNRIVLRRAMDSNKRLYDFMVPDRLEHEAWVGGWNYKRLFEALEPDASRRSTDVTNNVRFIGGVLNGSGTGRLRKPTVVIPENRKHRAPCSRPRNVSNAAQLRFFAKDNELRRLRISWNPLFISVDGHKNEWSTFHWLVPDDELQRNGIDRVALYWHGRIHDSITFHQGKPPTRLEDLAVDPKSGVLSWRDIKESGKHDRQFDVYIKEQDQWHLVATTTSGGSSSPETKQIKLKQPVYPDSQVMVRSSCFNAGGEFATVDDRVVSVDPRLVSNPAARIVSPSDGCQLSATRSLLFISYVLGDASECHPKWRLTNKATSETRETGVGTKVVYRDRLAPGEYRIDLYLGQSQADSVQVELI